jgi:Acyl-CoA thioesterase N-terminal domain
MDRRLCRRSSTSGRQSSADVEVTDRVDLEQAAIDEFLELLQRERRGDERVGRTPDWHMRVVFGGVELALTVSAACGDAPVRSRLHSAHAHFLRPVKGGQEIVFRLPRAAARRWSRRRDGITFVQDGSTSEFLRRQQTRPPKGATVAANAGAHLPNIFREIVYDDAAAAVEWLAHAFGFVLGEPIPGPGETIAHAELHYGPGTVMGEVRDHRDALGYEPPQPRWHKPVGVRGCS